MSTATGSGGEPDRWIDPSRLIPSADWRASVARPGHAGHPVTGLADLPEARREYHLWRYGLWLDYDGVEELLRELSPIPCSRLGHWADLSDGLAERVAVFGDDGRFHLLIGDRLACARAAADPDGTHPHQQWVSGWWTGTRFTSTDPGDGTRSRYLEAAWPVRLTGTRLDAALVECAERCTSAWGRSSWPPIEAAGHATGKLRTQLIAALGRECHLCHQALGSDVDHDHFTGQVRGLLCKPCNTGLDSCPHPSSCPQADYLNTPPAWWLNLRYPKSVPRKGSLDDRRIAVIGLDPWARYGANPGYETAPAGDAATPDCGIGRPSARCSGSAHRPHTEIHNPASVSDAFGVTSNAGSSAPHRAHATCSGRGRG